MRIAICDDNENYITETIKPLTERAAKEANQFAEIAVFTSGIDLLNAFEQSGGFDIVMLDIDMPELNGKQTAEKLRLMDSGFFLLFITSFKAEVFNTIPYRINAFIPKDSDDKTITSEIKRVISEYAAHSPEYLLFDTVSGDRASVLKLIAEDIFYFYCVQKKVFLKTGSKEYQLAGTRISELAKRFSEMGFFEVCRGYVVNVSKIRSVNGTDIELDNGEMIPLSRRRTKALMTRISDYVAERVEKC